MEVLPAKTVRWDCTEYFHPFLVSAVLRIHGSKHTDWVLPDHRCANDDRIRSDTFEISKERMAETLKSSRVPSYEV